MSKTAAWESQIELNNKIKCNFCFCYKFE